MKKLLIGTGIAAVFAAALLTSGLLVTSAFAQGPTPAPNTFPGYGACHNNQAVLDLLKINLDDLRAQRQAGKSLLDIATAKGVSEKQLIDALIQPVTAMHAWMGQTYGNQSYADQMTQWMRDWIAKDIRVAQFGTMTDFRLGLGGYGAGYGMMGNFGRGNFGGMMGGWRR